MLGNAAFGLVFLAFLCSACGPYGIERGNAARVASEVAAGWVVATNDDPLSQAQMHSASISIYDTSETFLARMRIECVLNPGAGRNKPELRVTATFFNWDGQPSAFRENYGMLGSGFGAAQIRIDGREEIPHQFMLHRPNQLSGLPNGIIQYIETSGSLLVRPELDAGNPDFVFSLNVVNVRGVFERCSDRILRALPSPEATEPSVFRDCPDCPEMVRIPGQLFAAGRYEVTFDQWDACVAADGCKWYRPSDEGWGRGDRPVVNVSRDAAQLYVRWLSEHTGESYRLLTEREWEIAALAGSTTAYSWGDQAPVCDPNARNGANFFDCPDDRTRPVGSFPANGFGLHDVHGNVWEWVEDSEGSQRVLRGGSWDVGPQVLHAANSHRNDPSNRDTSIGFRLARDL